MPSMVTGSGGIGGGAVSIGVAPLLYLLYAPQLSVKVATSVMMEIKLNIYGNF